MCTFFFRLYEGDCLASFFLDAYLRPAEKRGGAWMDECLVLCMSVCILFAIYWSSFQMIVGSYYAISDC